MKQNRIAKTYEGLTNKERAALAFHYLTNTNELEMARIGDAVPTKTYKCKDAEFMRWYESFFDVSAFWAIEHWRTYAQMLELKVALGIAMKREEHDNSKELIALLIKMDARLLALDEALNAVCKRHGIPVSAARKVSGTLIEAPIPDGAEVDVEFQKAKEAEMERMLEVEANR